MERNRSQRKSQSERPDRETMRLHFLKSACASLELELLSTTITDLDFKLFGVMTRELERGDPISFQDIEWYALDAQLRNIIVQRLNLLGYSYRAPIRTWFKTYTNPMVVISNPTANRR